MYIRWGSRFTASGLILNEVSDFVCVCVCVSKSHLHVCYLWVDIGPHVQCVLQVLFSFVSWKN